MPPAPDGPVEVTGWLRVSEESLERDLPRGQLASINLGEARDALGAPLLGGYLVLDAEKTADGTTPPRPARLERPDTDIGPHQAYAFQWWLAMPVGFVLLALSFAGVLAHSLAVHALTVGAIGGAIVAMITRTALGHTGRMLVAGPWEQLCYWLVIGAGVIRVFGPLVPGVPYGVWLDASGACWIVAFLAYTVHYAPFLLAPRADGRRD